MISLRTEMKKLRITLALACSFTTSTLAVAQARAAPRAAGQVFRDCRACPEMVVLPAGSFTMGSSAEEKSWASMTSFVASTRPLLGRRDTRPVMVAATAAPSSNGRRIRS